MVEFDENKLTITMDTPGGDAPEELKRLQRGLVEVVKSVPSDEAENLKPHTDQLLRLLGELFEVKQ